MSGSIQAIFRGIADATGSEDEFVGIGRRQLLDYSKVWSLLSVSIPTLDEAVPFFSAWRVFQSKLLI
jgi:hypothetical protein